MVKRAPVNVRYLWLIRRTYTHSEFYRSWPKAEVTRTREDRVSGRVRRNDRVLPDGATTTTTAA